VGLELWAPEEYWRLSNQEKASLLNGCGPDGWKCDLISDNWFIGGYFKSDSLRKACDIHDYMYATGKVIDDKVRADRVFLNNMVRTITEGRGPGVLRMIRLWQAKIYYEGVKNFGGPAFWQGKNLKIEMG
jgi:hypothetical protein